MTTLTPREHIEKIRRDTFYIGRVEANPLAKFLHQAVGYLSEELYTKDSHFIIELIQNAQDNEYGPDVVPSLEFVVTDRDLTGTGAPATLLLFNNERGFSPANVEAICGVGQSMKKGNRHRGYIGEKGIGFKSVFLVCSQPYIFSGGYQIKFNEKPSPECMIGYIVPEWVENNPSLHDIHQIYGSSKTLPATTIILPLKSEKVKIVKDQLSCIHPEIVLFLSKIRGLSVRDDNADSKLNTLRAVAISSETNFRRQKNIDAESYTLHLACQEGGSGQEQMCTYYMWRQKFPVRPENSVEKRKEVEEWTITLAFPQGQRLHRGMKMPGIYAFLPTGMVTNIPFIIQADFILVSSRECILLDNIWNLGILSCVAPAFKNALLALVKSNAEVPLSLLPPLFRFLPIDRSDFPVLETVRQSIKTMLGAENIVPCESYSEQRIFCKASEVGRLKSAFWNILIDARKAGAYLHNLSSHGIHILCSAFDEPEYNSILEFLGVGYVGNDWYGKCIESSNLAAKVPEKVYLDLLHFVADNWEECFSTSSMRRTPLLKHVNVNGVISLWSVNRATQFQERINLSTDLDRLTWLIKWNKEFESVANVFFVPEATQAALNIYPWESTVTKWLSQNIFVNAVNLYDYSKCLLKAVKNDRKWLLAFTHFIYHSHSENYLTQWNVTELCKFLPVVDSYGSVIQKFNRVLVPAQCSKWVGLLSSNPWRSEDYIELSHDYAREGYFAGTSTPEGALLEFLRSYVGASDVPMIHPPNAAFPTASSLLTKKNAFLLLDWIRNLNHKGIHIPEKFMHCVKGGRWLMTSVGVKAPEESFLSNSKWGNLLQVGPLLVDIPLIDQEFYDYRICDYKDELKTLGVMSEFGEACRFIGKHLMSLNLTRRNVVSMLKFIGFLTQRYMPITDFVNSIKEARWLKTHHGFMPPVGAVLYDSDWTSAAAISDPPFIDTGYYGENFLDYRSELASLGVIVGFDVSRHYHIVASNIKNSILFASLTSDAVIFMLECIRHVSSTSTGNLVDRIKTQKWVRTKHGLKSPAESVLFDPEWECVFKVVDSLPIVDEEFFGVKIRTYKEELSRVGVMVGLEGAQKAVAHELKRVSSSCSLGKEKAFALLACYRSLSDKKELLQMDFQHFIRRGDWLRTKLGWRSPADSILFDAEWYHISAIASLPFIDDGEACYGKHIHEYKPELKALGVVVEFQKGMKFIVAGFKIPSNPSEITSHSVLSFLKCIQIMKKQKLVLPEEFRKGVNKKWLKTSMGYKSPGECALFGPLWLPLLEKTDAPFIDEAYGSEIASYRDELKEIEVIVDPSCGNALVADHLKYHSDITAISRIYSYLRENKWKANDKQNCLIWIPDGNCSGEWVSSSSCVLHDRNNLFGSELHILETYYEKGLLSFFSDSFGVRRGPSISHYCDLWNEWGNTKQKLTESQCCAIWGYFVKNWSNPNVQSHLSKLTMLPVISSSGITLAKKEHVFIPDDLLLKDLFDQASEETLFVWHPQPTMPFLSMTELYGVYSGLGVRGISVAVEKKEISTPHPAHTRKIHAADKLFKTGLFRIILGFLADPSLCMKTEKRHGMVQCLLDATIFETDELISADYNLKLSSGKIATVSASKFFNWGREASEFWVPSIGAKSSKRESIEFATYFADVISEGLLWEEVELIPKLTELIRLGCLLDFHEDAVGFLLRLKNLQVFMEDEEFLSSALTEGLP